LLQIIYLFVLQLIIIIIIIAPTDPPKKESYPGVSTNLSRKTSNHHPKLKTLVVLQVLHGNNTAPTPLNLHLLSVRAKVASGKHVELIFILILLSELEPEDDTTSSSQTTSNSVVGNKERISSKRVESLTNSSGKRSLEERKGHDERTHVLGRLGEGVLERGDGGEDFGNGEKDVATGLSPDGNVDWVATVGVGARIGVLVDVDLDTHAPEHSQGTSEETQSDALDWGEADTSATKGL